MRICKRRFRLLTSHSFERLDSILRSERDSSDSNLVSGSLWCFYPPQKLTRPRDRKIYPQLFTRGDASRRSTRCFLLFVRPKKEQQKNRVEVNRRGNSLGGLRHRSSLFLIANTSNTGRYISWRTSVGLFLIWDVPPSCPTKMCLKSPWTVVWFSQIIYCLCDYRLEGRFMQCHR